MTSPKRPDVITFGTWSFTYEKLDDGHFPYDERYLLVGERGTRSLAIHDVIRGTWHARIYPGKDSADLTIFRPATEFQHVIDALAAVANEMMNRDFGTDGDD